MSSSRKTIPLASGPYRWPRWSSRRRPAGWRGTRWPPVSPRPISLPEQHWLLSLPLQSGKADDLVAHHVAVLWNLQFFFHLVNRLLLHPRHEVHFLLRQFPKPLVVVVAAVNDQDRPRSEPQRARHLDLAGLAFGHHRGRRQVAIVVQQQVQLDRALGPPEFRPVEHAHRQVDDAPVQTHQLVLETEFLPPTLALHQLLALQQRLLEHGLVKLPRSMFIGVGQRGLLGCHRHPQMLQLPLTARQSTTDLAQRMRPAQLAKQHRHELTPTGETSRVPLGLVLLHRLFEFPARKQFQHLRENAAYFHKAESPVVELVLPEPNPTLSGTQPLTGRRSPLRPAVSPPIWTAMDPKRKDLYVELEYMINHDATAAVNAVTAAFNIAPVKNPTGSPNGINLHVDIDEAL